MQIPNGSKPVQMAQHKANRVLRPSEHRRRGSRYVAALDGLRTFAVLAVIFYHMGLNWAPGGLMGVTVFFVISGYLINGLLVAEYDSTGSISLPKFWMRRVRRIIPAVLLALAGTLVLCALANHTLFDKARADLVPSLFFVNNWWQIFRDISYFEAAGAPSPLTHYWSLSIEEQFYIVWPILILVLLKSKLPKRAIAGVVAVLAVASIGEMAFLYSPTADPSRVYYGTDTRASSLLIGAFLALVWPSTIFGHRRVQSRTAGKRLAFNLVGVAALAGLVVIIVLTNSYTSFPYLGGIALVSVLTAVLIAVLVVPNTWVARFLQLEPLVWIGKRSYGMYLWHYPIILATTNVASTVEVPWWVRLSQLVIIIAVSDLSYRFVETPIRSGALGFWWANRRAKGAGAPAAATRPKAKRVQTIATVGICAALACGAGIAVAAVPSNTASLPNHPSDVSLRPEQSGTSASAVSSEVFAGAVSDASASAVAQSSGVAASASASGSSTSSSAASSAGLSALVSDGSSTGSASVASDSAGTLSSSSNAASATSVAAAESSSGASSASLGASGISASGVPAASFESGTAGQVPSEPVLPTLVSAARARSDKALADVRQRAEQQHATAKQIVEQLIAGGTPVALESSAAAQPSASASSDASDASVSSEGALSPDAASDGQEAFSSSASASDAPSAKGSSAGGADASSGASQQAASPEEAAPEAPGIAESTLALVQAQAQNLTDEQRAQAEEANRGVVGELSEYIVSHVDETQKEAELQRLQDAYDQVFGEVHLNDAGGMIYEPLLIGDSVAAGCENEFYKVFPNGHSDALVNRNIWESPYDYYAATNQVGEYVVFCLGTNNAVVPEQIDAMLSIVPDDKKVILVNIRCPRDWEAQTNQAIADATNRYEKVVAMVDWYNLSAGHDEYFYEDGIHLNEVGAKAYIGFIHDAIKATIR